MADFTCNERETKSKQQKHVVQFVISFLLQLECTAKIYKISYCRFCYFFCLRLSGKEDLCSTISKYRRYGITLLA